MTDTQDPTRPPEGGEPSGFNEPSEEVKKRNRVTGFVFLTIILAMIALAMIVRAYGG